MLEINFSNVHILFQELPKFTDYQLFIFLSQFLLTFILNFQLLVLIEFPKISKKLINESKAVERTFVIFPTPFDVVGFTTKHFVYDSIKIFIEIIDLFFRLCLIGDFALLFYLLDIRIIVFLLLNMIPLIFIFL